MRKAYIIGVLLLTSLFFWGACAPTLTPTLPPSPASQEKLNQTEDKIAKLQNQITALEKELAAKEATIQVLQEEIQDKQNKIEELEKALKEATSPQETSTTQPESTPTPTPPPPSQRIIEDLTYIKIFESVYSDDADPQSDGIALDISFYNSKSELITFRDTPVTVTIELYGYKQILDTFDHEKMKSVYQQQITVDHSPTFSEMFGKYIRIPFENIRVDQNKYCEFGTIKVTLTTSEQGSFQDLCDLVRLYPEE